MNRPSLNVSREGRDTLWLLAVISLCILPHLGRLPLWCSVGTALAIAWRAWLAWRDAPLPPRWVLLVALAAATALTLATHQSIFGRQAGVTLVTLLTALKTLELRARRDAFVVTSLGFFLVLTQFLHSQAIGLAALMLLATLGLLSSLVLAQRPHGRPSIAVAVGAAARSLVMGVPVMLALYLLFPRIGPLWSAPSDSGPRTGLSDRIELGEMSELALDDSVALRVRFLGAPPLHHEMYFRGPVLDRFDGQHWTSSAAIEHASSAGREARTDPGVDAAAPQRTGRQIDYLLTLEPNRLRTLPLLDGTLSARLASGGNDTRLRQDGLNWQAQQPLTERTQIAASAWMGTRDASDPRLNEPGRTNLDLPLGHNPRTLAWAAQWQRQPEMKGASADALVLSLLRHIRQGGYGYTLAPGDVPDEDSNSPRDAHPIDRFWLDRKTGFCEHYATAFVVILRAAGVPARVITGFQGAEINPVDGLHVVRNSDAHAWAEYWSPGQGWVRVDPTAAVAPNRIDRPRPPIRYPEQLPQALRGLDPALWSGLRAYADAANHRWNVWVLQYSRQQQMSLLRDWGFESPDWVTLVRVCASIVAALALGGLLWLWWQRPRLRRSDWHAPLNRLHRGLEAAGLPVPKDCPAPAPALSWAHTIARHPHAPAQQASAQAILARLHQLDALRYAPAQDSAPQPRSALIKETLALASQWADHAQPKPVAPKRQADAGSLV
jgi:signal transduction histidine kinase